MRASDRLARLWNSILSLLWRKGIWREHLLAEENWMRQMQRHESRRIAAGSALAVIAGRRWWLSLRGDGETALREAQLEPDEGYRPLRTRPC